MKKGPTTLDMLIEAIKASEDRKGASVSSIKTYLVTKYQVNTREHQRPGSKMFGYNEHPFVTSSFFYSLLWGPSVPVPRHGICFKGMRHLV